MSEINGYDNEFAFVLELNNKTIEELNPLCRDLIDSIFPNEKKGLKKQALNQCTRELLLAQSSDWLFIITNGTMVDYAKKRIKEHIGRFTKLYNQIKTDTIDEEFLKDISKIDKIFPDINYMIYC